MTGGDIMFMSMNEINERYDGEWIYAIDCEEDDAGAVLGGDVVIHSTDYAYVVSAMCVYDRDVNTLALFRYAGEIPEGISLLL